ncbi:MAG TPA: DUF222 domain-containing protein, partial [Acidimicrobiales bacterium]|nr:DUF222 domain-containing protein [Acidimicrobiales bacterium]
AHWKAHADAMCEDPEPPEPERALHLSKTLGGGCAFDGDLDAEGGAILATALRVAGSDDVEAEPSRSPAERRADALVDLCRYFLDHQHHRPGGRHRPHVNVVIDYDDLVGGRGGQVVDGGPLERSSIEALLCDCALHRVVTKGRSAVLDYGMSEGVGSVNTELLEEEHHQGLIAPAPNRSSDIQARITRPRRSSRSVEGGQGRPQAARRGSLDGPVISVRTMESKPVRASW